MTTSERIAILEKELSEKKDTEIIKKGETADLKNYLTEFYQLEEAQYDSAEAAKAFTDKMNEMGEQYPSLIDYMDAAGNAIIDTEKAENLLAEARAKAAKATLDATKTEYELRKNENKKAEETQFKMKRGFSSNYYSPRIYGDLSNFNAESVVERIARS
jgi:hypothetical protein